MAPLRYAAKFDPFLSNFPWIVPEWRAGDQILPSGNLAGTGTVARTRGGARTGKTARRRGPAVTD